MASERFANTLPFSGVKDAHDAIVVALHTFMIEAGYKCTGIGEEDVDKESSVDLTIDTLDYVTADNEQLLHHLYDYPRVVKQLPKLEQLFKSDIISKITAGKEESSSETESTHSEPSRNPIHDPFGFGDADRLPGHPGYGGMVMDPFHQRHRRPESDFGHPGLPRGAIPPGARFDPFGPVPPGGSRGRDPRSGRFSGPGPDHLPPPGFEDDMFM